MLSYTSGLIDLSNKITLLWLITSVLCNHFSVIPQIYPYAQLGVANK